jgi:hypothetical protein
MKEIPHFKEKMEELKGKPVKFTFVSVDAKEDWNTAVSDFTDWNFGYWKQSLFMFG